MSQETLGSRLTPGLSRASIANIEKGRQRVLLHSVLELARALELDVADLLDGLDPSPEAVGYENEISTKLADVNPDRVTSLLAKLRDDHE